MMIPKRRLIAWVAVLLVAAMPLLGGCESKKQREEVARLSSQVQTLTQEKHELQGKVEGSLQEQTKLKAEVNELTKKLADAEAKLAASKPKAKAPAPTSKKTPAKK